MRNVLLSLVFFLALAVPGNAAVLDVDRVKEPEPLLPYLSWLSDPEGAHTIDGITEGGVEAHFAPLANGIPLKVKGPVWVRLVIGQSRGTDATGFVPAAPAAIKFNSLPAGNSILFLPDVADGPIAGAGGWKALALSPHQAVPLPQPGLKQLRVFIRMDEMPGLWFSPVVAPAKGFGSSSLTAELILPGLLLLGMAGCLLRALADKTALPLWSVLYLGAAAASVLLPLPLRDMPITLGDLPSLLAPGMALLLLPHVGYCLLHSRKSSALQGGMFFLCSLAGAALCLAPAAPGLSWVSRLFPLWPLPLIPLIPLCLASLAGRRPNALIFTAACFMPVAGACLAFYALQAPHFSELAPQAAAWGAAVGGVGLALARYAREEEQEEDSLALSGEEAGALLAPTEYEDSEQSRFSPLADGLSLTPSAQSASDNAGLSVSLPDMETDFPAARGVVDSYTTAEEDAEEAETFDSAHSGAPAPTESEPAESETLFPLDAPLSLSAPDAQHSSQNGELSALSESALDMTAFSAAQAEAFETEDAQENVAAEASSLSSAPELDPPSLEPIPEAAPAAELRQAAPAETDGTIIALNSPAAQTGGGAPRASAPLSAAAMRPAVVSLHNEGREAEEELPDAWEELEETPKTSIRAKGDTFEFDLHSLVREVHNVAAPLAKGKGLLFSWYIAPRISPLLEGDAPRLRQALSLLLQNAIQATEHGAVRLAVTVADASNDLLLFSIHDSGSAKRTDAGFFHAWDLAARNGGSFNAEYSPEGGAHAAFSAVFRPVREQDDGNAPAEKIPAPAPRKTPGSGRPAASFRAPEGLPARILLAETTPGSKRLLSNYLGALPCEFMEAPSLKGIAAVLDASPAHLVLFDGDTPESDIVQAIAELHGDRPGGFSAPVAVLTGHAAQSERMLAAGAAAALVKPFSKEALVRLVAENIPALHEYIPAHQAEDDGTDPFVARLRSREPRLTKADVADDQDRLEVVRRRLADEEVDLLAKAWSGTEASSAPIKEVPAPRAESAAPMILGLSSDDVTPQNPKEAESSLLDLIITAPEEEPAPAESPAASKTGNAAPLAFTAADTLSLHHPSASAQSAAANYAAAPSPTLPAPAPAAPSASAARPFDLAAELEEVAGQTYPLPGIDGEAIDVVMLPLVPGLLSSLQDALNDALRGRDLGQTILVQEAMARMAGKAEINNLGKLAKICRCIERAAEADDLEAVSTLLADLVSVTERYLSALQTCYADFLNLNR